jgi:SAM-dependent methyltransferase
MDAIGTNRAHWEALARLHASQNTGYYDADALIAGRDTVPDRWLGDVSGMDVMHLQCHLAYDGISLARRGARVTGVDFSPSALREAAALAERCGVALELVEASSIDLPAALHGRFDLVYATIGVLGWIEDIDAWMRNVFAVLRPGGRLFLHELHPLYLTVAAIDPLTLDFPYAFDGPRTFDEDGSYADRDAHIEATKTIEFAHSLGEVVTACIRAGLVVDALHEAVETDREHRGGLLPPDEDGLYRLRVSGEVLPLLYTLLAHR